MLRFFTTWNLLMLLSRRLVKNESRGLLTLTGIISAAGITMICNNVKTNKWKWKNIHVNKYSYLFLEILIHQLPFIYMLKQPPKGNAWKALVPTCVYISIINNPYEKNDIFLSFIFSVARLIICFIFSFFIINVLILTKSFK